MNLINGGNSSSRGNVKVRTERHRGKGEETVESRKWKGNNEPECLSQSDAKVQCAIASQNQQIIGRQGKLSGPTSKAVYGRQ